MLTAIKPTKIPIKILVRTCLFSNRPAIPCFSLFYAFSALDKLRIIDDRKPCPKPFPTPSGKCRFVRKRRKIRPSSLRLVYRRHVFGKSAQRTERKRHGRVSRATVCDKCVQALENKGTTNPLTFTDGT